MKTRPLVPELDFHWIAADVAVGAAIAEEHFEALARVHGVSAVVDCRAEAKDREALLTSLDVSFLHLPTPDRDGFTLDALDRGVAWVLGQRQQKRRTLIHCQQGMGRSALLALCTLVARGGEPLGTFRRARLLRPKITLSEPQLSTYRSWLERRRAQSDGACWSVPELEALKWISWQYEPTRSSSQ